MSADPGPGPLCDTDGRPVNGRGGYMRHRRRNQDACPTCLAGNAAAARRQTWYAEKRAEKRAEAQDAAPRCETDGEPCNGRGGRERHRRRADAPCPTCIAAYNAAEAAWLAAATPRAPRAGRERPETPDERRERIRRRPPNEPVDDILDLFRPPRARPGR